MGAPGEDIQVYLHPYLHHTPLSLSSPIYVYPFLFLHYYLFSWGPHERTVMCISIPIYIYASFLYLHQYLVIGVP